MSEKLTNTGAERAALREQEKAERLNEYYKDTEFQGNSRAEMRRAKKAEKKYMEMVARMTRNRTAVTKSKQV